MSKVLTAHELRKQIKKQRAALPKLEQQRLSRQAVQHLSRHRLFRSARNLALYLPVRGEADPCSLLQAAKPGQRFFLPVLSLGHHAQLVFVEWNRATRFRNNRFNIPEPLLGRCKMLNPQQLDLVITPLVAFDARGTRLGMGGGFYDRSFATKYYLKQAKPFLVGLAYPFQKVDHLERQAWDIPLDASCTADGFTSY
ncbi:5-formyltetrahydrofolate cyclo-ligase [Thiothrix eikelboomii]|uniref:5-formyltetrahydrofolate cyclo-ligase n=1 Tax=Thiothrix eikelboomii TaxID=92487 RepID=A0A1T4VS35_9GAMM|nr:5-formyltetrahydrofolate cyclo-ligase [Thiothrix eikelboomii]SKA67780.1 5-formyltetrahydrofolate cyclo-ligase [Thiothrix eikelboomii]